MFSMNNQMETRWSIV